MEQDKEFTEEHLDWLINVLKKKNTTMYQRLYAQQQEQKMTQLQKVRLDLAQKNCPHLVPMILDEIENGIKQLQPANESKNQNRQLTPKEVIATVCAGFCKKFGVASFNSLPKFQQETFKAMAMLHLGYMPADKGDLSQNKAVYLCGKSQIGKTTVFEYLKASGFFTFRIVTSYELVRQAKTEFDAILETYTKGKFLLIDEVGMENAMNSYGNKHDVVAEIIHERYRKGLFTHFTSNLIIEDLPYDAHIKRRIEQGCNVIVAKGAEPFMRQ